MLWCKTAGDACGKQAFLHPFIRTLFRVLVGSTKRTGTVAPVNGFQVHHQAGIWSSMIMCRRFMNMPGPIRRNSIKSQYLQKSYSPRLALMPCRIFWYSRLFQASRRGVELPKPYINLLPLHFLLRFRGILFRCLRSRYWIVFFLLGALPARLVSTASI